jgi:hypothetical protein
VRLEWSTDGDYSVLIVWTSYPGPFGCTRPASRGGVRKDTNGKYYGHVARAEHDPGYFDGLQEAKDAVEVAYLTLVLRGLI